VTAIRVAIACGEIRRFEVVIKAGLALDESDD
jgi:hypothetical protein